MKLIPLTAIAAVISAGTPALADATSQDDATIVELPQTGGDPQAFVTALVGGLSDLAQLGDEESAERQAGTAGLLRAGIATERMKRFVLSRGDRSEATEEQLGAYDEMFGDYIVTAWTSQIDQLVSRTIDVREVVEVDEGDYVVRSKIVNERGVDRASVDWRVLDIDGTLKLVDVMINGSSFNVDRRAQFSSIIANQGFDALLDHMREEVAA